MPRTITEAIMNTANHQPASRLKITQDRPVMVKTRIVSSLPISPVTKGWCEMGWSLNMSL